MTHSGVPSLRVALAAARKCGCNVAIVRKNGEVRVIAPDGTRLNINSRRKDATPELTKLINRLAR